MGLCPLGRTVLERIIIIRAIASPLSVPGSGEPACQKATQIPSAVFIDGTHIKANANKKKFQKEQVAKAAKVYSGQLRREVNAEREKLGKEPIEDENDNKKRFSSGRWKFAEYCR